MKTLALDSSTEREIPFPPWPSTRAPGLQMLLSIIGGLLIKHIESDFLAELFHRTCDRLHCAEEGMWQ